MYIFWAGTETSFNAVTLAEQKVAEGQKQGRYGNAPTAADLPPLWDKIGSTGVVQISGSLINGSAGWMQLYGVVGYDDIAAAATAAASDPEVKSLMFNVSSGGGHVHGLAEFAATLNKLSKTKPSLTYVPDTMASAAFWSGSSVAGPIVMAPTAEVGSLGILMVAKEYSKQLAAEGITVKVLRAGDMKARVNPFEPLTPEAEAQVQSQLDDLHKMFKDTVRKNRPTMSADQLKEATDGRTFLGQRAITAGLADSIGSYPQALKLLDKGSSGKHTSSNSKGATMYLTAEQIAAIAGGATLASLGIVITPEEQAEIDRLAAEAETARLAAQAATDAATKAAADTVVVPPVVAATESVNDLLKSQLSVANASLLAANVELTNLKASTQSMTANHDGLLAIARGAVANMLVPMGGTAAAADAMDATTVIAEHARVKPLFLERFKPGQVTKSASEAAKPAIDPDFLARTSTFQSK
jgi:signal peptide peptidase SppA